MKIIIDARLYGLENGGIGRYLINLISNLSKIDKENNYVILLSKKHFNKLKLTNNFKKQLADIKQYSVKEQTHLPKLINDLSPDLVHFPHFNVPINYKGKFVTTIHDLTMHKSNISSTSLNPVKYQIKRKAYKLAFKNAIKKSNKLIVPSNFVSQEIQREYHAPPNKISVIYEGVTKFSSSKQKSKLIPKEKYFLYVGSLYPHKNIDRLIESIIQLNKVSSEKTLLLISSKEDKFLKRLKDKTSEMSAEKYIKFLGFVKDKDLSSLYKNAVAFVFPSLSEGFGLPGLEAFDSGTLLLSSDIPVLKEIYKENCIYFNPYDFTMIEREMRFALNMSPSKRKQIIFKAKKFAQRYSWKKMAKETLQVYENVIIKNT